MPVFSSRHVTSALLLTICLACAGGGAAAAELKRMKYNHPGLTVDLGVGLWAWPLPMDFDGDGDLDLVVNCPDKPSNGVWFFENATGSTAGNPLPVFKPGRRISQGLQNAQISWPDGKPAVTTPGAHYPDFTRTGLARPEKFALPANIHPNKVRGNMWRLADFDGDGAQDLLVGADDWTDYGWDNAWDTDGRWTRGPLRGLVYWIRNTGSSSAPVWAVPVRLQAGGRDLEVFGWPSPNLADFDGDGDSDLICGEFLDGFTWFENTGTRTAPVYAAGRRLHREDGAPLVMDLQMITPVAIDWNLDGKPDLICGDEDGRVAFLENTGRRTPDGTPLFAAPRYFRQEADDLKFGALVTPFAIDWDRDGDTDLLCGNTAGHIGFLENLSGPGVAGPRWAAPVNLQAGGREIRLQAGPNGSIQGPAEAKWGYTTLTAADWDGDGLTDLVVNSILGKVIWFRHAGPSGSRGLPVLEAARSVEVEWEGAPPVLAWGWLRPEGKALLTQWRTTPVATDWNRDGLTDLIMLDAEGFLAFFQRERRGEALVLLPPRRIFQGTNFSSQDQRGRNSGAGPGPGLVRLSTGHAGASGRRKLCLTDWDGDGRPDFLVNAANALFLRQTGTTPDGLVLLEDCGLLSKSNIEGHDVSPATADFNADGRPDFIGGAEDGKFYYLENPASSR